MAWDIFYKNKWRCLLIGTVLALAGCGEPWPNDRVIFESNKCKRAGFVPAEAENWKFQVTDVRCHNPIYN